MEVDIYLIDEDGETLGTTENPLYVEAA